MVTASVERSSDALTDIVENLDLTSMAVVAAGVTGGLFAAQEINDQVLPMLDFPQDPSAPLDLAVSALLKLLGAAAVVSLGSYMGGNILVLAGVVGYGFLASAGLDVFDAAQRGGVPGDAPAFGSSGGSPKISPPSPSPSQSSPPVRRSSSSTGGSSLASRSAVR